MFTNGKSVSWPSEFSYIVNMLVGKDSNEESAHPPMYKLNVGAIVLAAVIGLVHGREREVGPNRKGIATDTFAGQKFANCSLDTFLLLIPVLSKKDIELLRPNREDEVLRIFERYAAGGLEYLRGALFASSDSTGQLIINNEINKALRALNPDTDDEPVSLSI